MDLWQLNIFCKVVELRSFSKAGKIVHLSQPTISSHIKDLENHFGCRLIDRLARAAIPTKAGELLYGYARRLTKLKNDMETALSDFQGLIKGHLLIGGSTIPGVYFLPRIIGVFTTRFPEVSISLKISDTDGVINHILAGELEIGVVGSKTKDKHILQHRLMEDEMRLIVPATHKWVEKKQVDLKMLCSEPFIIREKGSGTRKSMVQKLGQKGVALNSLNIIAEMGSTEAVCQGIKNGVGISILSVIAVAEELNSGKLKAIDLKGIKFIRHFYLTHHSRRSISPLAMTFADFLRNELHAFT
ncbi:MAG: selenium metabolism-associated LysR family transcriptional regulator [Desulfobacterales bacterium]|nr:selenium metabolism-associated LysR family transcriptional regulator [Desulfobacterales bacterium]